MEDDITQERTKPIFKVRSIVSHLLYADDVMIFLEANLDNSAGTKTKQVFDELANTTGLQINLLKSKV